MTYKYQLMSLNNSKLSKDGITSINMPPIVTCPGAGECKKYCYAQVGMQAMGNPKNFRLRAYQLWLDSPLDFKNIAKEEIRRSGRRIIRWHDSGDIVSLKYLKMMISIALEMPEIKFYTYSKSISIIRKFGFENLPVNLKIIQSYGGREDHLIDESYPFAKVFLNKENIPLGFTDMSDSDYLAATTATKIAIVVHGGRKSKFV